MSENKPEWFEMADADRATQMASTSISHKRTATLLAFTAPLMILGAGLVIAQSTNVLDATAAAPITQIQSSAPATSDSATEISTSAAASTTNPQGLVLPAVSASIVNGDDDDESGDDDDESGDDDDEGNDD